MRRRWHDWVITLGIVALAATGVWTLWGADLARLFRPAPPAPTETVEGAPRPVTPPPGQAAGPF